MKTRAQTLPAPELVAVEETINELFELDNRVAEATPALLPLESQKELIDFLTVEHQSDNYLQKNNSGKAIAYISLIDTDRETMEVLNIGVDPLAQNCGVGRALMKFAENKAKTSGKKKIILVTNTKNLAAVNFYKKLGYRIAKTIDNYYGDGETRHLFEKLIS
jgi:ribosomal protein S18 acetylase RimI-like enzyme